MIGFGPAQNLTMKMSITDYTNTQVNGDFAGLAPVKFL
jgi:hypothetical protein